MDIKHWWTLMIWKTILKVSYWRNLYPCKLSTDYKELKWLYSRWDEKCLKDMKMLLWLLTNSQPSLRAERSKEHLCVFGFRASDQDADREGACVRSYFKRESVYARVRQKDDDNCLSLLLLSLSVLLWQEPGGGEWESEKSSCISITSWLEMIALVPLFLCICLSVWMLFFFITISSAAALSSQSVQSHALAHRLALKYESLWSKFFSLLSFVDIYVNIDHFRFCCVSEDALECCSCVFDH